MDDENAFATDEVKAIINKVLNALLKDQLFVQQKVDTWVGTAVENVLKELAVMNDDAAKSNGATTPFKYAVHCTLQQKAGAGLANACTCYWDKALDGCVSQKWENEHIQAVCVVYGVAV